MFEGGRYYVVRERLEDGCGITNGDVRRIGWNDRVILVEQETCKVLNAPPELMLIDMTTQAVSGPFSERDLATMPELRSIHLVNADEVWDKLPIFGS